MKLDVVITALRLDSDKERPFYPDDYYITAVFKRAVKLRVPDLSDEKKISLVDKIAFNESDYMSMPLPFGDKELFDNLYNALLNGQVLSIEF